MMKHFKRFGRILLLGGAMLYFGCQTEELAVSDTRTDSEIVHRHIDFETFSRQFPKPAEKLREQNEKTSSKMLRGGVYDPINDFTILTDNIFMAERDGEIYFTFAISREVETFSGLENLLLVPDGLGGFSPFLTRYDISQSEKNQLTEGGSISDLAAKTSMQPLEGVDFGGVVMPKSDDGCWTLTVSWCGEDNHEGGEVHGHDCPAHQEIVVSFGCGGGSEGGSDSGSGPGTYPGTSTPGNNTGGSGNGPGGPPSTGTPNNGTPPLDGNQNPGTGGPNPGTGGGKKPMITGPVYIPTPPRTVEYLYAYISPDQKDWLTAHQNSAAANYIYSFTAANNYDSYSMNITRELINISIELNMNAVEVWQNLPDYRSMMSQAELQIFDGLLTNRKLWYLASGKKAFDRAEELFPTTYIPSNLHNGKGDAFRHAFWNGLSALRIGYDLTQQLTNAHENRPADPSNSFEYKEVEMDLHNNNQGLIASQYSSLSNIELNVLARFNSGYLKYLNNLQTAIPYFPSIHSVLIPTNQ